MSFTFEAGLGEAQLRRSLRLIDLVLYGIVFMSPIAAFAVFGYVRAAAHGAVALAYVIGCVGMILTGCSYAAMARAVPVAGSVYHYASRSLGKAWGFIAGWAILLDYILLPALMILIGAVVMSAAIPAVPVAVWVLLFLLIATVVNVLGLKVTASVDILIALLLTGVVVAFIAGGLGALYAGKGAGALTWAPLLPPSGLKLSYAVSGASVAVLSFLGFDAISTLAEEISGGDVRAVGRATIVCLVVMGLMYVSVSWLLCDLSPGVVATDPGQTAFAIIDRQVPWLALPVTLAVGLGTGVGSAIPPQAAVARVLFAMARDAQLPRALARVHPRYRTPYVAVLFIAIVMAVVALGFVAHVDTLLSLCNFGALVAFLFVNAAVIAFHVIRRRSTRWFVHLLLPGAGFAVVAYVLSGLSRAAIGLGAVWLLCGSIYYIVQRARKRAPPVTILLIGTADTKTDELNFLRAEMEAQGHKALIMDVGVLRPPGLVPDIDQHRVAAAAGSTIAEIAALGSENLAMQAMARGAATTAAELCAAGRIDGVLAIGGTMGTDLALEVAQALPLGVAKLIVSSVSFSHIIPPERIAPDLMMVLWAGGLWGLNTACTSVLRQAAGAVVGAAVANRDKVRWARPVVGISSLGSSCTRYLRRLKPELEQRGYEVVVFHAVGPGGRALESLVEQRRVVAVLDLTLIEVSNHVLGSVVSAGADRLEAAGRLGVPQIVAPGGIDGVDLRPWLPIPDTMQARAFHPHNRLVGAARTSPEEKQRIAATIATKLNRATGPTAFIMPLGGVDEWDRPGGPMHDAAGIAAFSATMTDQLASHVQFVKLQAHINDAEFSTAVLEVFDRWVEQGLVKAGVTGADLEQRHESL